MYLDFSPRYVEKKTEIKQKIPFVLPRFLSFFRDDPGMSKNNPKSRAPCMSNFCKIIWHFGLVKIHFFDCFKIDWDDFEKTSKTKWKR